MRGQIYRTLRNRAETFSIGEGESVRAALPDIDFENALVLVNNKVQPPEYMARSGDRITVRALPSESDAMPWYVWTFIVPFGAIIYPGLKGYEAKKEAERAQEELEKVKKLSNKADIDNRPFLRGASNTLATGNSQPYVIGRHFFTPYLLCSPFYRISGVDGADEYTYTVLECGFNKQIIQKLAIDDIIIKTFGDTTPQEGAYELDKGIFAEDGLCEISQDGGLLTAIPELNYKVESKSCNDEIPRDSDVESGTETPLTYTLNPYAKDVTVAITFPQGLFEYDSDNDKISASITITPQYSLDGGTAWIPFTFGQVTSERVSRRTAYFEYTGAKGLTKEGLLAARSEWIPSEETTVGEMESLGELYISDFKEMYSFASDTLYLIAAEAGARQDNIRMSNTFSRNVSDRELRFTASHEFSVSDYDTLRAHGQSAIMLRLTSNGKKDGRVTNSCYCLFYQSVCYDPNKSAAELVPCKIVEDRERGFCTILGLKLKASKINEDKLKKINVITQGVARTWDGTAWSAEKTATRNPAAWALEVLTSDSHPASRYDDGEIDLDSFGEYYDWCELNGYKFDWVITQNTKKDDTLKHIMEATGSCMYYDFSGRRAVAIDRPQENAIAVYNPQNIVRITNKKDFKRRTDGLRIKYTNSKNDIYQEDTYLVMREVNGRPLELDEDSIIRDLTVTGITEHEHIVKYARRMMACEALRPKSTTIDVGNEGIFYAPYSKVLIQDDSLKIGIGKGFVIKECVWWGGLLKKIRIDGTLNFDDSKAYGIIVNCYTADGARPVAIRVDGDGATDELTVLTAIRASADAIPEAGNVFSFGELDIDGNFTRVTTEYLIASIKRNGTGFTLELVNYNEAVYDSGTIPAYKSNITQKATSSAKSIPADTVTRSELADKVAETVSRLDLSDAAQEAANVVTHGVHFTNIHKIDDMVTSLDEVIAKLDDDARRTSASISMSEEEILLRVDDMEKELVGLISVQAGAVTALVAGGGAEGKMSLSLELPAMIDASTRAKMVQAASEEEVSAVYARLDGTEYWAIKGNAGKAPVKALWEKAVSAALIASQIDLSATQINVAAEHVVITGNTNRGQTIIEGGYLRSELIEVNELLAQTVTMKSGGIIRSQNYNGRLTGTGGTNEYASRGWAVNSVGNAEFIDMYAWRSRFEKCEIENCTMQNGTIERTVTINGLVLNHVMGYGPYSESWHINKLLAMIDSYYINKEITCIGRIGTSGYDDNGNHVERGGVWVSLYPYSIRRNSDNSITFMGFGEKHWYTNGSDYVLHRAPLSSITFPGATDALLTGASWGNRQDKWDVWIRF